MEVGRITARIEAEVGQFERQMQGAQRTFQQTASKMQQSAGQAHESVRRFTREEAAWMRENVRLDQEQSRSRMRSTREAVQAAREQARIQREGMQMARLHSQALAENARRNALLSAEFRTMAVASEGASLNLMKLRGSMTSLASSVLSLGPGVTQVGSALGALALSGGTMVAVLAGAAALGFAWDKLTSHARKLKEETQKATEAIEGIGRTPSVVLVEQTATLNEALEVVRARMEDTREQIRLLQSLAPSTRNQRRITTRQELLKQDAQEELRLIDLIGDAEAEKDRLNAQGRKQHEKEIAQLRDQLATDSLNELNAKLRSSVLQMQMAMQRLGIPGFRLPSGPATTIQGRARTSFDFRTIRAVEPLSEAGQRVARRGQGPFADLGQQLKGMFDPRMIASGLATGGLSLAVSKVTSSLMGVVDSLLFGGKRIREAMEALSRSIEFELAGLRGDTKRQQEISAIENITDKIKQFGTIIGKNVPNFSTLQELIAWMEAMRKALNTLPLSDQQRAVWEQLIEFAKELGLSLGKAADAANSVTSALTNVPTGFKVALARFNATIGLPMQAPNIPGTGPRGAGGVINNYTFEAGSIVATDPKDFLEKLEIEVARKEARGGSTLMLSYS